ncbi:phosphotransferase [Pseudomonas sp. NPDC089569]|uniref:phosphotransferase n=1 Tax=Pseudomonas sp. NPDC089569 TaxID=3390722 RepID=UPI003D05F2F5
MTYSNSLIHQILYAYDLQPNNIEVIYSGINKVLRITARNKRYIFKMFKKSDFTKSKIAFERKIMMHIHSKKINCAEVISPICTTEQTYTLDNQLYFGIMMHESLGKQYSTTIDNNYDFLFGQALFELHNCPKPALRNPQKNLNNAHHLTSKIGNDTLSGQTTQLKKIILNLVYDIGLSNQKPLTRTTYCICHGDAWPGNAIYRKKACSLIDFEHTRLFDPTFDIATFIWWLTGSELNEDKKYSIWKQFTSGYGDTVKKLTNNKIPTYIKTNQLRSLIFLLNNIFVNDEILDYAHQQTFNFVHRLKPYSSFDKLLEDLWKS